MLVRGSTEIDDVAAAFEALVMRRIPQQSIVFLDDGYDRLAAGRGVAADDRRDPLFPERPFLTPGKDFEDVSRGSPLPHTLKGDDLVAFK